MNNKVLKPLWTTSDSMWQVTEFYLLHTLLDKQIVPGKYFLCQEIAMTRDYSISHILHKIMHRWSFHMLLGAGLSRLQNLQEGFSHFA